MVGLELSKNISLNNLILWPKLEFNRRALLPPYFLTETPLKLHFYHKLHLLRFLMIYSLLRFYWNWQVYDFFPEGQLWRWEVTLLNCQHKVNLKYHAFTTIIKMTSCYLTDSIFCIQLAYALNLSTSAIWLTKEASFSARGWNFLRWLSTLDFSSPCCCWRFFISFTAEQPLLSTSWILSGVWHWLSCNLNNRQEQQSINFI